MPPALQLLHQASADLLRASDSELLENAFQASNSAVIIFRAVELGEAMYLPQTSDCRVRTSRASSPSTAWLSRPTAKTRRRRV